MHGQFLVSVVLVITLWIFVILVAITPWFGVTIVPYLVIFTFLGAVIILSMVWAYKEGSLENIGWEAMILFFLLIASIGVAVFVIWYFIRKKLKKASRVMKDCGEDHHNDHHDQKYNPPKHDHHSPPYAHLHPHSSSGTTPHVHPTHKFESSEPSDPHSHASHSPSHASHSPSPSLFNTLKSKGPMSKYAPNREPSPAWGDKEVKFSPPFPEEMSKPSGSCPSGGVGGCRMENFKKFQTSLS